MDLTIPGSRVLGEMIAKEHALDQERMNIRQGQPEVEIEGEDDDNRPPTPPHPLQNSQLWAATCNKLQAEQLALKESAVADAELRCRVLELKVEETGQRWVRKVSEMQDERNKTAVESAEREVALASKQNELLQLQHVFQETVVKMENAELRCRVLELKVEETCKRWSEECVWKVSEMQEERNKTAAEAAQREVALASKQNELLQLQHVFRETVMKWKMRSCDAECWNSRLKRLAKNGKSVYGRYQKCRMKGTK
jgi:hypothetical protein